MNKFDSDLQHMLGKLLVPELAPLVLSYLCLPCGKPPRMLVGSDAPASFDVRRHADDFAFSIRTKTDDVKWVTRHGVEVAAWTDPTTFHPRILAEGPIVVNERKLVFQGKAYATPPGSVLRVWRTQSGFLLKMFTNLTFTLVYATDQSYKVLPIDGYHYEYDPISDSVVGWTTQQLWLRPLESPRNEYFKNPVGSAAGQLIGLALQSTGVSHLDMFVCFGYGIQVMRLDRVAGQAQLIGDFIPTSVCLAGILNDPFTTNVFVKSIWNKMSELQ